MPDLTADRGPVARQDHPTRTLDHRLMRSCQVGITRLGPTITRLRDHGWILLDDLAEMRHKQVRLLFGRHERSLGAED